MSKRKADSPKLKLAKSLGFRSILEHDVSKRLTKSRIIWEYEPTDKSMTYNIVKKSKAITCANCGHNEYHESHKYLPDFYIPKYDLYLEAKGYMVGGASVRKKMKALIDQGERIVMLFQSPYLKISKGSKTTYAQWAERSGIPWLSVKDNEWTSKLKSIFKN